ncbi:ATP-binding protein (plasmid) [Arthrobacter sp. G.S.26]|uniref:ATP-binding protein n=1 Tax=Arthrobacter sp. G.S.26 TaxID=3433706 RepID=UPI003D778BAF
MGKFEVVAGEHLLENFVGKPVKGLTELIWNALDADADTVRVHLVETEIGGFSGVIVEDDGLGMSADGAISAFKHVGESWKRRPGARTEKHKRSVHGEQGRGRYAAFGLGEHVVWSSVADGVTGQRERTVITGRSSDLRHFDIDDAVASTDETGTKVEIFNLTKEAERDLLKDEEMRNKLLITFAMHLQTYPSIHLSWKGAKLTPEDAQLDCSDIELKLPEKLAGAASVTCIEWDLKNVPRQIFLCDADGSVIADIPARFHAPGAEFTAYIKWDGFRENLQDALIDEAGESDAATIIAAAKVGLKKHLARRTLEQERRIVSDWQNDEVYPYKGDPANEVEKAERQAFNIVALTAARVVNETKSVKAKKLSLRLIKEALEASPGSLHRVLEEVLNLPDDRVQELQLLLERTPLASMISSSKQIADRLDFLKGLDSLLFDKEPRKTTLERTQLHRILAVETWIFGEEWAKTGDDERLVDVARKHLSYLGEDVELGAGEPIKREDGRDGIPDLVLARSLETDQDMHEMLIVELKRPSHKLKSDDVDQLRSYATAMVGDERFAQPNINWHFWLVGNSTNEGVDLQREQTNLPFGVVTKNAKFTIWVKTWAEVLGSANHRHKFLRNALNFVPEHDAGIDYLRKKHEEYLPKVLLQGVSSDVDAETSAEQVGKSVQDLKSA